MSTSSAIEWTNATRNPVRGCTQVSPGCAHCYALAFAERFRGVAGHPHEQGFDVRTVPKNLELPLHWRAPKLIFVNSMSDLYHESVPEAYIRQVFDVMARAHWHTFQILTKRHERLAKLAPSLPWAPNIWQGVSIESNRWVHRADSLRLVPAAVRFLSCEPLLGPLDRLDLTGIHWLIGGGESGLKHRPFHEEWACDLRDRALAGGVPFFWKQNGGRFPKKGGKLLAGVEWRQWPARPVTSPALLTPG